MTTTVFSKLLERGFVPSRSRPRPTPGQYSHSQGRWFPLKWGKFREQPPSAPELNAWATYPEVGAAVVMGRPSGVVAVDLDQRAELHPLIRERLPDTPVRKRGSKGETLFFRYDGQPSDGWWYGTDKKPTVELLSDNALCTIPPSVHPTGVLYEWTGPLALDALDPATLPALPPETLNWLDTFFAATRPLKPPTQQVESWSRPLNFPAVPDEVEYERVRAALAVIPPEGYHLWVSIGMAIASRFPGPTGFALWDDWSQGGSTYEKNRPGELRAKWKSFKSGGKIGLGTLYHHAKEHGYDPRAFRPPVVDLHPEVTLDLAGLAACADGGPPSVDIDAVISLAEAVKRPSPTATLALPLDLLTSAPGLVGEIAEWLAENNSYWQPSYGLAAALSFVGMCKGHMVRTEGNFRTNQMCVAVGPSSSAKSMPMKRVQELARKAGLAQHLCGEPASDQGLHKAIHAGGHKVWLAWDEIGIALKAILSPRAPSYLTAISKKILQLFSAADTVYAGTQYASQDDKNPRLDLHEPCLCLYGTSTEDGIYGAMSSVQSANGFAARLLIFETHDYTPPRRKLGIVTVPDGLVEKVRHAAGLDRPVETVGNLVGVMAVPTARIVPFTPDAEEYLDRAVEDFEGRKNDAIRAKNRAVESIWGRAFEHASKVALTVEDGPEITLPAVEWAVRLVTKLSENMVRVVEERVADNEVHSQVNEILKRIKDAGPDGIGRHELLRSYRSLKPRERDERVSALLEEGTVEQFVPEPVPGKSGPRPVRYRLKRYS